MISSPTAESLVEMYGLKRQILFLTQSVWPLRGVVNSFGHSLQSDALRLYIRDLYDHIVQIIDTVEAYRSILSEMVEIYLSSISNKLNEVMKILTIISTIFMPLAFITGVYGMNFKHMPFLENQYGYPLIVGLMAFISILMLLYFRRRDGYKRCARGLAAGVQSGERCGRNTRCSLVRGGSIGVSRVLPHSVHQEGREAFPLHSHTDNWDSHADLWYPEDQGYAKEDR
jgi:hypothetical protein